MRRWLWACLALVVAVALTLWSAERSPRGVAPVTAPVRHAAREPARDPIPLLPVDDERSAALVEGPVAPAIPAQPAPPVAVPTRLVLLVLEPDGRAWPHGALELSPALPQSIVAERTARASLDAPYRGGRWGASQGLDASAWSTDEHGRVEIAGIAPGELRLVEARDRLGYVGGWLVVEPLAPGEARELVLRLDWSSSRIEGRCVDASGLPLERVRVLVDGAPPSLETLSDADGRFAVLGTFQPQVEVSFRRRGLVGRRELLRLPLSEPPELVLERARSLTVTLVDELGESFVVRGLEANGATPGPRIDRHPELRDGAHIFESMPFVPVTLTIVGCGLSPTLEVDATSEEVRWRLPRPGELEVPPPRAGGPLPAGLVLELHAAGSSEPMLSQPIYQLYAPQRWTLFPGRYVLQFRARAADEETLEPYGPERHLEVRSGEVVVVPLGG